MRLCLSCDRHIFDGTITCPFCRAPCGTVRGGSLAILGITLGVALTACVESKPGGTADVNTTPSSDGTGGTADVNSAASSSPSTDGTDGTAELTTTASSSPSTDETDSTSSTTFGSGDSLDAWGGTYTVSGDSSWTASPNETGTGTDTDTTGTDTDAETGTSTATGTETGTSTTTTTDTGSTDAASSTG